MNSIPFEEQFKNVHIPFGIVRMFDEKESRERGFLLVFRHVNGKLRLGAMNGLTVDRAFAISKVKPFMRHMTVSHQLHETE